MSKLATIVILSASMAACTGNPSSPTAPMSIPALNGTAAASPNANGGNFGTPLSADEEVMPPGVVNGSGARGNAIFHLSADGTELEYRLIIANIENAFMAHIHAAAAGSNGPVVAWLYPSTAVGPGPFGSGRFNGVAATGTITAANLLGPLAGQPLSALVALIEAGGAYVNVHTNDGVSPTNTGPGDFPGGEIRGQIEHRGH